MISLKSWKLMWTAKTCQNHNLALLSGPATTQRSGYDSQHTAPINRSADTIKGGAVVRDIGNICQRIRKIQTTVKECKSGLSTSKLPFDGHGKIKDLLKSFHEPWLLDISDTNLSNNDVLRSSVRLCTYESSISFRDLDGYLAREALSGVTVLEKQHAREEDHTVTLRRFFLLRKLVHPCLVEFYRAYWPGCNGSRTRKDNFN